MWNYYCFVTTDGVDLMPTSFILTFRAEDLVACAEIEFIDNKIGLQANKIFPLRLTVLEPADVGDIIVPDSTLTIVDDDGTFYRLNAA